MMGKEETENRDEITDIEYMDYKGREVLVCMKTGIKTQHDPRTGAWKVGESVGGKHGMSVSVSGHGVRIFMTSDRAPIRFVAITYGKVVPDGMYFPAERVIALIPLLEVATRVAQWLQRNPEYPKRSGCVLSGSGSIQKPADSTIH